MIMNFAPSPLFHHAPQISSLNCFSLLRTAGTVRLSRSNWRSQLEQKIWRLGERRPQGDAKLASLKDEKED